MGVILLLAFGFFFKYGTNYVANAFTYEQF